MGNYFPTREAKEDLWRIYGFEVYKFGASQAEKYFNMMNDRFEKIASNPYMFPETIKYQNVQRYCVCDVDTIFYGIKNNEVEIVTIIGRQDY